MADTRRDKRAPVALKVRYKSATVDEFLEQYSEDISRGGTFIKSKKPMPVGTLLKFELQLKDESRLIHGVGRVVWTRDPEQAGEGVPAGMGIKFIKMDPDSRALVQKILDSRGDRPGKYDAAGESGEAPAAEAGSNGGGQPFFPSTTPEDELPAPEDRTAVRHASEFLAQALADTDEASANEARAGAEEARKRTEEIERARASLRPGGGGPGEAETADVEERVTNPAPSSPDLAAEAGAFAAEAEAGAGASAGAFGTGEAPSGREDDTARTATPTMPEAEAEPAAEAPAAEERAPMPRRPAAEPRAAAPAPRSKAVPILLALVAVAVVGYLALSNFGVFGGKPEGVNPTAEEVEPVGDVAAAAEPAAAEPAAEEAAPSEPEVPKVAVPVKVDGPAADEVTLSVDGEPAEGAGEVKLPVGQEATVTADAKGYKAVSKKVTATEGDNAPLSFELEEEPYMLMVETEPPGVRVRAGGGTVTTPGRVRIRHMADPVAVIATRPGFLPAREDVPLSSFEDNDEAGEMQATLKLTLEPRARGAQRATKPKEEKPKGDETAKTEKQGEGQGGGGEAKPAGGETQAGGGEAKPAGGGDQGAGETAPKKEEPPKPEAPKPPPSGASDTEPAAGN